GVLLLSRLHSVRNKRVVYECGVQFDNHLPFYKLLLDLFGTFDLLRNSSERMRNGTDCVRLFNCAFYPKEGTRAVGGNRRRLFVSRRVLRNGGAKTNLARHYFRPQICLISPSISPFTRSSASIARS